MPGFMPGIHVFLCGKQDVDGRTKSGHDVEMLSAKCARQVRGLESIPTALHPLHRAVLPTDQGVWQRSNRSDRSVPKGSPSGELGLRSFWRGDGEAARAPSEHRRSLNGCREPSILVRPRSSVRSSAARGADCHHGFAS